jgi:hypothetical protein
VLIWSTPLNAQGLALYCSALDSAVTALQGLIISAETQVRINRFDGTASNADAANIMKAGTALSFNFSYFTA